MLTDNTVMFEVQQLVPPCLLSIPIRYPFKRLALTSLGFGVGPLNSNSAKHLKSIHPTFKYLKLLITRQVMRLFMSLSGLESSSPIVQGKGIASPCGAALTTRRHRAARAHPCSHDSLRVEPAPKNFLYSDFKNPYRTL